MHSIIVANELTVVSFFMCFMPNTCNCLGCSLGSSTNLVFASLPHFYGGKLNKVWCLRAPLFSIQNTSTQDVQQNITILSSRLFTSFNQPPNSALVHLPPTNSTRPPCLFKFTTLCFCALGYKKGFLLSPSTSPKCCPRVVCSNPWVSICLTAACIPLLEFVNLPQPTR